jgi:hypothetical protein
MSFCGGAAAFDFFGTFLAVAAAGVAATGAAAASGAESFSRARFFGAVLLVAAIEPLISCTIRRTTTIDDDSDDGRPTTDDGQPMATRATRLETDRGARAYAGVFVGVTFADHRRQTDRPTDNGLADDRISGRPTDPDRATD